MPLPYTPDRELDPPENDEPLEKEYCDECGKLFDPSDLFLHHVNSEPIMCCSECLHKLNQ